MIQFSDDQFRVANIDKDASIKLLGRLNNGEASSASHETWDSVQFDGRTVVDSKELDRFVLEAHHRSNLEKLISPEHADYVLSTLAPQGVLDHCGLESLGLELLPLASFGILNGGAATSFVDFTKNSTAYGTYFSAVEGLFSAFAGSLSGKPKGLAPAFFNQDGSPGYSFLALKLHNLSLMNARYQNESILAAKGVNLGRPLLPWVQMANAAGLPYLESALASNSFLVDPRAPLAQDLRTPKTGLQALITAFKENDQSGGTEPRYSMFVAKKDGAEGPLGLPGGHGQVYDSLGPLFADLLAAGKRFIWLGNIDNLGFTPNLLALALSALEAREGLFEFSYKTPMDTKGGILVRNKEGNLSCADIGQAISPEALVRFEAEGKPILFNCATGLFDLTYLVREKDHIQNTLPLRASLNKKDIGTYIAVEQSAWEIMGILKKPLVLAVEKSKRFLASKFILDSFLTSGLKLDTLEDPALKELAQSMNRGLEELLQGTYGLVKKDGLWTRKD